MPFSSVLGASSAIKPGVVTSSTRPSAPYVGQLIFETDTNRLSVWNGSSWIYMVDADTPPGLELVKAQTIGTAVSSVEVTGAFSSTYENYRITMNGGSSSVADINVNMVLGSTSTGYYSVRSGWRYAGTALNFVDANNGSQWLVGSGVGTVPQIIVDVLNPNLAQNTFFSGVTNTTAGIATSAGYQSSTTQFTAFTLTPSSGTLTGGTIRVYGYRNS
jgi:hypothetical protein